MKRIPLLKFYLISSAEYCSQPNKSCSLDIHFNTSLELLKKIFYGSKNFNQSIPEDQKPH